MGMTEDEIALVRSIIPERDADLRHEFQNAGYAKWNTKLGWGNNTGTLLGTLAEMAEADPTNRELSELCWDALYSEEEYDKASERLGYV